MSAPKSTATRAAKTAAKASSASDFKKRKKGHPLLLPSGLTLICQRVGLRNFLSSGDIPNPLMPIVEEALDKGSKMDVQKMISNEEGEVDLDMIRDMYEMVDQLVVAASVEPKVHEVPEDDDDRDDDLVYVDEVDDEDKMFIFQWCIGGTDDIARFRQEAETDLVAVAQGAGGGTNS